MSNSVRISIDQAIHGYAGGHTLLACSAALTSAMRREMLLLSDLSGPSANTAFYEYLTGYPIGESGKFAFAKTWYASEMERPGCVWTHTLIIDNADLPRIEDLRLLKSLFARPDRKIGFEQYNSCLTSILNPPLSPRLDTLLLPEVLYALYSFPESSVIIPSASAAFFEDLVLLIWSQQWPRLRRSFRFCTGSLLHRRSGGSDFDLQVMPQSGLNVSTRDIKYKKIIGSLNVPVDEQWIKDATDDILIFPVPDSLREFLWKFGADLNGGRKDFSSLVRIQRSAKIAKSSIDEIRDLVELTSSLFPEKSDAGFLKSSLFGTPLSKTAYFRSEEPRLWDREIATIYALSLTQSSDSFELTQLAIVERAISLAQCNPEKTLRLITELIQEGINIIGEGLVKILCDRINEEVVISAIKSDSRLRNLFVTIRPHLAERPELWSLSVPDQYEIIDAIESSLASPATIEAIVYAMLENNASSLTRMFVKFSDLASSGSLNWINDLSPKSRIPSSLESCLSSRPELVLAWMKTHYPEMKTIIFICSILDPNSPGVIDFGIEFWLRYGVAAVGDNTTEATDCAAFFLAISLKSRCPGAACLFSSSFEKVYSAIAANALGFRAWNHLKSNLPELPFWKSWDKCERLRRAIVDKFTSVDWPISEFIMSLRSPRICTEVLSYCSEAKSTRKLLKRALSEVSEHNADRYSITTLNAMVEIMGRYR